MLEVDNEYFDVAELTSKYLSGGLTGEEDGRLSDWLEESEGHREWFRSVTDEGFVVQKRRAFQLVDWRVGWEALEIKRRRRRRRRLLGHVWKCAGVVVLLLLCTFYIVKDGAYEGGEFVVEGGILPGCRKAVLFMADGSAVELGRYEEDALREMDGTVIGLKEDGIVYGGMDSLIGPEVLYNEIIVPRGGEFQLTLADGTFVHLNADSRLRFPVQFSGDRRVVELTGEGYFQVVRNEKRPFVVKASAVEVSVLGTEFNLSCYLEDEEVLTTLVRGKVEVAFEGGGSAFVLNPGERAVLNRRSGKMVKEEVDVSYATAWKDGVIRFRDRPLKEIMGLISRWYDVKVVYKDPEVKEFLFGCNFDRDASVEPLLELFESTGTVHFDIKGKEIIVSK